MSTSCPVNDQQEKIEELSCIDLALEGERLCRAGQCRAGVLKFEGAVRVGTEDLKTLCAIYSQLGNAYFYLQEYEKALQYHRHDLTLARTLGDQPAEAKASGNLGNTLKVLGKFDEAVLCAKRYLEISREIKDKVRMEDCKRFPPLIVVSNCSYTILVHICVLCAQYVYDAFDNANNIYLFIFELASDNNIIMSLYLWRQNLCLHF